MTDSSPVGGLLTGLIGISFLGVMTEEIKGMQKTVESHERPLKKPNLFGEEENVMPEGSLPRYKIIRCKVCGKIIRKFDRKKYADWHVPKDDILASTRRHYKKYHPKKFKASIKKGVETRKRNKSTKQET